MKYILIIVAFLTFSCTVKAQTTYKLEGNQLVLPSEISFKTGSDQLTESSEAALLHVKNYLIEKSYISTLRVEVHTDNQGDENANLLLSEKRALSIGRWLVAHGVDCKRILCVGFGDSKPVAVNSTPEGRAQNRRVAFVNAALRERAIGGMPLDGGGKVAGDLCSN